MSGLVVTLAENPTSHAAVLDALRAESVFTLGEQHGRCVAVVLETADEISAQRWHDWLAGLTGVIKVDVAFTSFDHDVIDPDTDAE